MKTATVILFLLLSLNPTFSQQNYPVTRSTTTSVSVVDISKANTELSQFITANQLIPVRFEIDNSRINVLLRLDSAQYNALSLMIPKWGYIFNENTESNYYAEDIKPLDKEIELLEKEKHQYEQLTARLDSGAQERYFNYWEKIISLDRQITTKIIEKEEIIAEKAFFSYQIYISEESGPDDFYDDSWVNMPGIEYSLLQIEQPLQGETPETMTGINLKYLFNTRKSYGILGLYKSSESDTASEIDDMYIFALGQDFYSKRMGRGQRQFFNLYTSFNAGVYIATSQTQKVSSWFVNPFLGLEVFKNKYFLLDNKVGYFLPFKNNRTQRGLLYNVSFNFVF